MTFDPRALDGDTASLLDSWFPPADSQLAPLRDRLQSVKLPAGCDVFHRGDACRHYLLVVEGCVRVQALSASGREVVLYRVTEGQSCVITTSCLISGQSYPAEGGRCAPGATAAGSCCR